MGDSHLIPTSSTRHAPLGPAFALGCSPAEFEGLTQRNVRANAGLDWAGLGALLRCIADRSLELLANEAAPASVAEAAAGDAGASAGGAAEEAAAAEDDPGSGDRGCHAFRLQRAALVLGELVAEQQRVDAGNGSSCGSAPPSQQQGEQQLAALQPPYHAAEAAANSACLHRIADALGALGLALL